MYLTGLCCLSQLKDWRTIQEERAKHLYRNHTLRRFLLAMLDHVTQERLMEWDREVLAQEHNNRSATRDFPICSLYGGRSVVPQKHNHLTGCQIKCNSL